MGRGSCGEGVMSDIVSREDVMGVGVLGEVDIGAGRSFRPSRDAI